MSTEVKLEKATKLLDLTGFGISPEPDDVPDEHRQMSEVVKKRERALLIELYAKHFSEAQLDAQLDFHSSDVGRSIIDVQQNIAREYAKGMSQLSVAMGDGKVIDPKERGPNTLTLRAERSNDSDA